MNIKKHFQTEKYPIGDCFRACVASILQTKNMEDVPNFMKDGEDKFDDHLDEWIKSNGYIHIKVGSANGEIMTHKAPVYYPCIITVKTTSAYHAVVGYLDEDGAYCILHDPNRKPEKILEAIAVSFIVKSAK